MKSFSVYMSCTKFYKNSTNERVFIKLYTIGFFNPINLNLKSVLDFDFKLMFKDEKNVWFIINGLLSFCHLETNSWHPYDKKSLFKGASCSILCVLCHHLSLFPIFNTMSTINSITSKIWIKFFQSYFDFKEYIFIMTLVLCAWY